MRFPSTYRDLEVGISSSQTSERQWHDVGKALALVDAG